MSATTTSSFSEALFWAHPLPEHGCGQNIEYQPEFLALQSALAGKPETQFSEAEQPNWPEVVSLAESCLTKTRDLRVISAWIEAKVAIQGVATLATSFLALADLLVSQWSDIHPKEDFDQGDLFERVAALEWLGAKSRFQQTLRYASVFWTRSLGDITYRHLECAIDPAKAADGIDPLPVTQLKQLFANEVADEIRIQLAQLPSAYLKLTATLNQLIPSSEQPEWSNLKMLSAQIEQLNQWQALANQGARSSLGTQSDPSLPTTEIPKKAALTDGLEIELIKSRQAAIAAIDAICEYLDKAEPTNPAQYLLRRARRLMSWDFLRVVQDLHPESLSELARLLGVDPEDLRADNPSDH